MSVFVPSLSLVLSVARINHTRPSSRTDDTTLIQSAATVLIDQLHCVYFLPCDLLLLDSILWERPSNSPLN